MHRQILEVSEGLPELSSVDASTDDRAESTKHTTCS